MACGRGTKDSQARSATAGEKQICAELREMYSRGQGNGDRPAGDHVAPRRGLLRTLVRLAETTPGLVIERADDYVDIPFGALGLRRG